MAHSPNSEPQKRKRDIDDIGNQPVRSHHTPTHSSPQPGISGFINYLPSSNGTHLNLIHGDVDTFSEIIGLIGEYEGVLDRHESLAASLGAKLTGPRLLKGIEKFFDGPIKATPLGPLSPVPEPVSWLDIVSFARANPKEFTLCSMPDGSRCCQFTLKGLQVEITEDDWRLIWSGALERFPLDHPFEEDEIAESATLDILEQRTSMLYKKADEVAARARILHHRLEKRKQDIRRRRKTQDTPTSRLHNSNHEHSQRSAGFGTLHDIHADLLQQFTTASTSPSHSRSASVAATSMRNAGQSSPGPNIIFHQPQFGSSARLHGSTDSGQSNSDTRTEPFRAFITHRIEKLEKGDVITPPCDRCRRLNTACQKHLSACVGCTKKHAKCSWKALTDEEMRQLKQEPRISGVDEDRRVSRDERPELPSLRDSLLKSRGREGEVVHESAEVISEPIVYENGSRLPSQESAPERFKARSADSLETVQDSHSSKRSDLALAPASRTPDQWKSTQIPSISSITSALRQDRATTSTHTETVSR